MERANVVGTLHTDKCRVMRSVTVPMAEWKLH